MLTLPIKSDLWTTNDRLRTKKKEAWDYKKTHLDTIDQLDTICDCGEHFPYNTPSDQSLQPFPLTALKCV